MTIQPNESHESTMVLEPDSILWGSGSDSWCWMLKLRFPLMTQQKKNEAGQTKLGGW